LIERASEMNIKKMAAISLPFYIPLVLYFSYFFAFNADCAAANLAIGTRNGEQET